MQVSDVTMERHKAKLGVSFMWAVSKLDELPWAKIKNVTIP
jgi:hypothetical protein